MSVQTYKITRRGPKYFRVERLSSDGKPSGEPVRGPRSEHDATGNYRRIGARGLQGYGIGEGLKDTIRCTPEEAKKIAHMKLVPIVGGVVQQPKPPEVAENWHTLSAQERISIACAIAGREIDRVKEADKIIGDYVASLKKEA